MEASFQIRDDRDIVAMEGHIRKALQCASTQCTFLRSAPYLSMRIAILRRLRGIVTEEADIRVYINQNQWLLWFQPSTATVTLSRCNSGEEYYPKPDKKRKLA
jgi:hypothetical protein